LGLCAGIVSVKSMSHLSKRGDVMDAVKDVVVRVATSCRKWMRQLGGCDHGRHRKATGSSYHLQSYAAFAAASRDAADMTEPNSRGCKKACLDVAYLVSRRTND
jgi:hypothetical protein